MISEDRLAKALTYLAETDEPLAHLKAEAERQKFKAEAIKAAIVLTAEGTVAEKQAQAVGSQQYTDAMNEYFRLTEEHDAVKNKRSTEVIVVEVWRSLNASRRAGNI